MTTIQIKRGLKANLPALAQGELAYATDSNELYVGSSTGNQLLANLNWSAILGKPTFSTVATSGSYTDLTNKPAIPSAYTLSPATSTTLGGVKIGSGVNLAGDGTISASLSGLSDVDSTNKTNGYALQYDSTAAKWVSKALPTGIGSGATSMSGLSDVDVTTTNPQTGNVLEFQSGKWVPGTISAAVGGNSYVLELSRWGITNSITTTTGDATLAQNNSNGINNAIQWAFSNNYTEVVFPTGTYLIHEKYPIQPTSFMTLNLNGSTLRIRDNAEVGYSIVNYMKDQQFVRVTNGFLQGDRYNHDYYSWDQGLSSFVNWTKWQASTAYSVGQKVMPTNTYADNYGSYWLCTTAGTSGATEPVWNDGGSASTSGTAVFTPYSRHTHEWGMGVLVPNQDVVPGGPIPSTNIRYLSVDNMEIYNLTGDGVSFFATGSSVYTTKDHSNGGYPYNITFEQGSISSTNGSLLVNANMVRSNIFIDLTNANIQKYGFFGIYGDISWDSTGSDIDNTMPFDIYFYDSAQNFLGYKKNVEFWDETPLLTNAASCKIVLHQSTIPAITNSLTLRCELIPKFCFIEKCHIHQNRRLGVTLQGAKFIWVRNNDIHHIKGTGPDGCMDIEDNYAMNQNLYVEDNYFHDSQELIIVVKGKNFHFINNKFENGVIQTDSGSKRIFVGNNYFKDVTFNAYTECIFFNNHLTRSMVSILDGDYVEAIVSGNVFNNSSLSVSRMEAYKVIVDNCRFFTDADVSVLNNISGGFGAGGAAQTMTNCSFEGIGFSTGTIFGGSASATEGWSYTNCLFTNNAQTQYSNRSSVLLARGTYTNCRFNNPGSMSMSYRGEFIGCSFTWDGYSLFTGGTDLMRFRNCTFHGGNSTCFYFSAVTSAITTEIIDCFFEYPAATSTTLGIVDGYWSNCTAGSLIIKGCRFRSNMAMKTINNTINTYDAFNITMKDCILEGSVTYAVDQTQLQNFSGNIIGGVNDPSNWVTAPPTTGFYKLGKQLMDTNMVTDLFMGWICVQEGFLDTYSAWTASKAYSYNNRIAMNGYVFYCTNRLGGTSGATAPTFPTTVGATVSDNGITWKNIGATGAVFKKFGTLS